MPPWEGQALATAGTASDGPGGWTRPSVPVMVMVVASVEVDRTVIAVMVMPLVAVAVAMAMVIMLVPVVMVMMAWPALVPLRGGAAGGQHQGSGNQTCDAKLHGRTCLVRDVPRLGKSR